MPESRRRGLSKAERLPALAFAISIVSSIALFVVYWQGGQTQAEGILLAVTLGGVGIGLASWAKRFMPAGPFVEPRGRMGSTEEELDALAADFAVGAEGIARRGFLATLFAGAVGAIGIAALFPIRSLGPRPGKGLKETPFKQGGLRLVTEDGEPVRPENLAVDGVVTVFPEGHTDAADAPTLLIHLPVGVNIPREGREDYAAGGDGQFVAYSKLCSHLGCPVGLYEARDRLLLCPCHQSTFDVPDGCRPIFGPAPTSLPQLPIDIDDEGYFFAQGDFSGPVGPAFWNEDR